MHTVSHTAPIPLSFGCVSCSLQVAALSTNMVSGLHRLSQSSVRWHTLVHIFIISNIIVSESDVRRANATTGYRVKVVSSSSDEPFTGIVLFSHSFLLPTNWFQCIFDGLSAMQASTLMYATGGVKTPQAFIRAILQQDRLGTIVAVAALAGSNSMTAHHIQDSFTNLHKAENSTVNLTANLSPHRTSTISLKSRVRETMNCSTPALTSQRDKYRNRFSRYLGDFTVRGARNSCRG